MKRTATNWGFTIQTQWYRGWELASLIFVFQVKRKFIVSDIAEVETLVGFKMEIFLAIVMKLKEHSVMMSTWKGFESSGSWLPKCCSSYTDLLSR